MQKFKAGQQIFKVCISSNTIKQVIVETVITTETKSETKIEYVIKNKFKKDADFPDLPIWWIFGTTVTHESVLFETLPLAKKALVDYHSAKIEMVKKIELVKTERIKS